MLPNPPPAVAEVRIEQFCNTTVKDEVIPLGSYISYKKIEKNPDLSKVTFYEVFLSPDGKTFTKISCPNLKDSLSNPPPK